MGRVSAIVFDLDGTLYNSRELADEIHRVAVRGLALQLKLSPEETAGRLMAAKRAVSGRSGCEATLSAACLELGGDLRALHDHLAAQVQPEPFLQRDERVVAMLRRLRERFALYLYSNNNRRLATRIMGAIGLEDLFASVITIEDCWRAKPDRLALARLWAAIGAAPDECLFVGDRYDVDLRLPEEQGSLVFRATTVAELLTLETFCTTI